jgi:predicted RNA-binding Zn-ribbon protein involved in translation (DUF1610 family)
MACAHNPKDTRVARGAYPCPECGEMVIAGCQHPTHNEVEEYAPVDRMTFNQLEGRP